MDDRHAEPTLRLRWRRWDHRHAIRIGAHRHAEGVVRWPRGLRRGLRLRTSAHKFASARSRMRACAQPSRRRQRASGSGCRVEGTPAGAPAAPLTNRPSWRACRIGVAAGGSASVDGAAPRFSRANGLVCDVLVVVVVGPSKLRRSSNGSTYRRHGYCTTRNVPPLHGLRQSSRRYLRRRCLRELRPAEAAHVYHWRCSATQTYVHMRPKRSRSCRAVCVRVSVRACAYTSRTNARTHARTRTHTHTC